MYSRAKKLFLIGFIFLALFAVFTVLVCTIDVKNVGQGASALGFATVNKSVFESLGTSDLWLTLTDVFGYVAILAAASFACLGAYQLIRRKSLKRIDTEILLLGALYVAVVAFYVLFELVIINYAPVLKDGEIAASYPSSHVLLVVTIMASAVPTLYFYTKKRIFRITAATFSTAIIILTVIGRLLAGVHWLTDIFASLLLSTALVFIFSGCLALISQRKKAILMNRF